MNTVRTYHQRDLSTENRRKLQLSRSEIEGLCLREIQCPYCGYLVERVFSDVTGHKMVYCKKCKEEYPVNLGYFRRVKRWKPYEGFRHGRQRR